MLRLVALLLTLSGGAFFVTAQLERQSLYPFDRREVSPSAAGLTSVTAHQFERGAEPLVVWTAPPRKGQPVVFYLHGNAGNLALRAPRFERLLERGYGLVAMAYRGSSGSAGKPSEEALKADARLIWLYAGELLPAADTAPRVLYGESLGTAVAIVGIVASTVSSEDKGVGPPAALVLEAPFTSIADVAANISPRLKPLTQLLKSRWESLRWANQINMPLLVIHGTQDELIPIAQGRKILEAASARDKQFLVVRGAGHNDLWRSDVLPKLWAFIERAK